jgi:aminoglycoside phosphotransferase (APT) family kinase protein
LIRYLSEAADEAQVLAVLARELPDLKIERLQLVKRGWDNTVAIADKRWVFRFPKDADYAYAPELALLKALQGQVGGAAVPNPAFEGRETQMLGYGILPGRFLEEEEAGALDSQACRHLGQELAAFVWGLHQRVSPEAGLAMGWRQERLDFCPKEALAAVRACCPELDGAAQRAADAIAGLRLTLPPRFLYNDLHIDNFLVDAQGRLSGVIDFGDCAVGDPHFEFYGLWRYNPALFEATISAYEGLSGLKLDRSACQALAWEDCLSDLAELKDQPQDPGHQNALRWMRRWAGEHA